MADALASLVTRGATRPDGKVAAPLIHITCGLDILIETMIREAARAAGEIPIGLDGQPLPDELGIDPTDPLRRCEFVDGTPIHPKVVLGLLSVATLRRLVLSAEGEILDLGMAVRNFPRHLKDAMLAAARGRCSTTGCDAPPSWLQADHVIPFTKNGPTATRNGKILCAPENKAKGNRIEPER